ncbi:MULTISPECIES: lipid IV(A) 3-deoxy-D-manno-octulosonic acid transferase [Methylomonas]|uniref:3-deoxy-D-manno-octulosonic acid transferase n=2 Tax=Methylomonas TaxID=416 RepID=A0A126T7Y9_9GAMM|nr:MULTISPECIES: lipid IV(A) 3-deoxy-D-manno-octulosonic acid transferase [Methylomonas]AMK78205.1 3-deoxy-D-manno-octulosonic acid transferase [Methylomonas denitrificans]OAI03926.1 3-deoxy-D-manno-octulosonic acid transferase [Methylomonas methanica]TCV87767.1 3-deoxy-D-manno-octulosonic-acid transferase [Methylomonas methanica]
MRQLYTLVFGLILPAVLLRLYWRGSKAPAYRQRWRERLGIYSAKSKRDVIWLHAVSVGEAEAAFLLIKLLQAKYPEIPILVTTTTPTGSARVQAVLADQVEHVYLPYDLPFIVQRFLQHFRPRLAVIMEKEIWPNLFAACAAHAIPLFVINARLSERSARSYRKIPKLVKPALACVNTIAVQTEEDRVRFLKIGAESAQLQVLGNIKFDVTIDAATVAAGQALKQQLFAQRWVWIVASTHQGEEEVFLDLYPALKTGIPELLLLIVPRHPERFQTVKKLCEQHGLSALMRSEQRACSQQTDVYIADSMGELKMLYAAADLAFVGGSLVPVGGHNVLEPAAIGVPVLFGPEMFNFQEIADRILTAEGAVQCADSSSLKDAVLHLFRDELLKNRLADNGRLFVRSNQGATARVAALLEQSL